MITEGIDVSVYQGNIDWQKVAKSGIDFAIIKAGQGHALSSSAYLFEDKYFKKNIKEAYSAGIKCGVYYYVTATTVEEAEKQANHFLSIIRPYRNIIALSAAADIEDVTPPKYCGKLSPAELTDIVLKFCETVEKDGFKSMLYTNRDYLENHLEADRLSKIPLWRAHWRSGKVTPADAPKDYAENMKIWQYGTAELDGIGVCVDVNYGYFADEITADEQPATEQPAPAVAEMTKKLCSKTEFCDSKTVPFRCGGFEGNGNANLENTEKITAVAADRPEIPASDATPAEPADTTPATEQPATGQSANPASLLCAVLGGIAKAIAKAIIKAIKKLKTEGDK